MDCTKNRFRRHQSIARSGAREDTFVTRLVLSWGFLPLLAGVLLSPRFSFGQPTKPPDSTLPKGTATDTLGQQILQVLSHLPVTISGEASDGKRRWPCSLMIDSIGGEDKHFEGQCSWDTLDGTTKVQGHVLDSGLSFTEVSHIKKGNVLLNCKYSLDRRDGECLSGGYNCPGGQKGTVRIALFRSPGENESTDGRSAVGPYVFSVPIGWKLQRSGVGVDEALAFWPANETPPRVAFEASNIVARDPIALERAIGIEIGKRILNPGWYLRGQNIYRTQSGFRVGRFDYAMENNQKQAYYSYILIQRSTTEFLGLRVMTAQPFSRWAAIDTQIETFVSSVQTDK